MSNLRRISNSALVLILSGSTLAATAAFALPQFGDWSAPASIESLPGSATNLNSPAVDGCVSESRDGLSIYFNSNRAGTQDIYVATRATKDEGFGTPVRLPEPINTVSADEFCPTIALGNRLFFSRTRATDPGDLMVSHAGSDGWEDPVLLGSQINSPLMEESASFYEDQNDSRVMLFSRRLPDGSGGGIFASVDGGAAVALGGGPDSPASDNRPSVTHDGLTLYFDSTRTGGLGGPDLWVATRATTDEPFGPAAPLTALNSPGFDARPSIAWDGSELFFSSNRAGSKSRAPDIWHTARSRSHSGPKTITF